MGVEIEVNALSAKPLGQIAAENIADLFALEEVEDLPHGLRVRLKGFAERLARAVADMPNGVPFADWMADLGDVPAARVPTTLRVVIAAEADAVLRRGPAEREAAAALLAVWDQVPPEPFAIVPTRVIPRKVAPAAKHRPERSPREIRAREPSVPRAKPIVAVDEDRVAWIRSVALDRLDPAGDRGLLEAVLLAGIQHRGAQKYPDLTGPEIRKVLEGLAEKGSVKHSASRWTRVLGRR